MAYSNREKADCAKREVKQRQRIYARRVENGDMSPEFMRVQIAMMTEIADEYEAKAVEDEKKERLF
jgi:hypothetical protein